MRRLESGDGHGVDVRHKWPREREKILKKVPAKFIDEHSVSHADHDLANDLGHVQIFSFYKYSDPPATTRVSPPMCTRSVPLRNTSRRPPLADSCLHTHPLPSDR